MNTGAIMETIQAMHKQEASGYVCADYLNLYPPEMIAVNVDCRTKMAQWCYSVSNLPLWFVLFRTVRL